MKTIVKWLFRLLILLIVLAVAFVLLLDTMARALTERELERYTGLEVNIGRMEVGLFNPKFHLQNVVIFNSPEFGGSPMIDLPDLQVEYRWGELMKQKLHLTLLRINLAELHIVEGREGKLNLQALDEKIRQATGVASPGGTPGNQGAAQPEFGGIDTLNLSVSKLKYSSLINPDTSAEFDLGLENQLVTGIQTERDLLAALQAICKRRGLELFWEAIFGKTRRQP